MKLIALAMALCVVAACGAATGSPSPSTGTSSSGVPFVDASAVTAGGSPSSAPAPTPTPDPETVRKAAAKVYAAAAAKYNKDSKALAAKYKTFGTLKRARAFYLASGKLEGAFVSAVKVIPVPADTSADMHALIAKVTALQALCVEGSKVRSWADVDSVAKAITTADRTASGAANLVRTDLGLPPVS